MTLHCYSGRGSSWILLINSLWVELLTLELGENLRLIAASALPSVPVQLHQSGEHQRQTVLVGRNMCPYFCANYLRLRMVVPGMAWNLRDDDEWRFTITGLLTVWWGQRCQNSLLGLIEFQLGVFSLFCLPGFGQHCICKTVPLLLLLA